ncbi:hypothetical protein HETIRDRAFT_169689 [Heterobasidion irregulare TC 32-1]|uniref:Uncharacterized protein n=1 Tax=Heterobasidion irregulare (strain TC 32-1) TaxID=747525 RepID=W4K6H9_HETIT|nr:uncharacterized protein HETIRDRAFT_169689 [Heterobasidion irregulare TC 32-1]ETW80950.1 hypothetical protein HETIRDRAFT_169689 [Heterobasidion irregulare TC 32-1]
MEPFHTTFTAKRRDGSYITTINPHTKAETNHHHLYIAPSQAALEMTARH